MLLYILLKTKSKELYLIVISHTAYDIFCKAPMGGCPLSPPRMSQVQWEKRVNKEYVNSKKKKKKKKMQSPKKVLGYVSMCAGYVCLLPSVVYLIIINDNRRLTHTAQMRTF